MEIGISSLDGGTTYNSLHSTSLPISPGAFEAHGYSREFLSQYTPFSDVRKVILQLLMDKHIVVYNKLFDIVVLKGNMGGTKIPVKGVTCAMNLYTAFNFMKSKRWSLPHNTQCAKAHSASGDICSTQKLIKHIANTSTDQKDWVKLSFS